MQITLRQYFVKFTHSSGAQSPSQQNGVQGLDGIDRRAASQIRRDGGSVQRVAPRTMCDKKGSPRLHEFRRSITGQWGLDSKSWGCPTRWGRRFGRAVDRKSQDPIFIDVIQGRCAEEVQEHSAVATEYGDILLPTHLESHRSGHD